VNSSFSLALSLISKLALGVGGGALIGGMAFLWARSGRYPQSSYAQVKQSETFPIAAPTQELTVVSYNIGYLSGLTNNLPIEQTPDLYAKNQAIAVEALDAIQPDILALQEVDLDAKRSLHINQVEEISQALQFSQQAIAVNWDKRYVPFPYWPPAVHFGPILSGQAILSRFPITQHERLVLEKVASNPAYYTAFYLDRLAQVTKIEIGDRPLLVINVHLEAFDYETRLTQTRDVLALAEDFAQRYPVILLGDFNSALNRPAEGTPYTISLLLDSEVFATATPPDQLTERNQFTFPSDAPQYKLDYGFYTPDTLELLEAQVLTTAAEASDHLPLMLRVRLR